MNDINNKYLNTCSSKIRYNSMIKKYMLEKMLSNQNILRYIKYCNKSPLLSKSKDYEGNTVTQPDLTRDDVKGLITHLPFSPDMSINLDQYIFENITAGSFRDSNYIEITITVVTEEHFEDISDGLRGACIAQEIANIFDKIYVTEPEWVSELGNIQFDFIGHSEFRLSKSNNYIANKVVFRIGLTPFDRVRL